MDRPVQLVDEYATGDFFLASAGHTILGSGVAQEVVDPDPARLSARLRDLLDASSAPVAVGILPFDTTPAGTVPSRMVLPAVLHRAGPAHPQAAALTRAALPSPLAVRPVPEPRRHVETVAEGIRLLAEHRLHKIVLARALDLEFAEPPAPGAVLRNLVKDHPRGYTFAAGLPGGATFLGATPELLLSRTGRNVSFRPHAGSAPRSDDPLRDKENGRALFASTKDRVEHAVVIESMVECLRPFCRRLSVPGEPEVVSTPTIWHLATRITGELADPEVTALDVAAALHPTPAVCGSPTDAARRLVTGLEPFDRDFYAGAVGWVDANGDGEWAVAIRCAELAGNRMRLYAGGGIVADSDPEAELAETSVKFRTLLRAMGVADV
ncbi:isochorismate synthase [Amycolatopsis suaedae]|uniref:isochorismate synthase n=1 Tax=Amycolatopsis suaedae TaxID=2510978 RepID=A0A4Q7J7G9_9PSEU|nr:isochorismate synthase [Amycolatopsis suaedae]